MSTALIWCILVPVGVIAWIMLMAALLVFLGLLISAHEKVKKEKKP